MTILLIGVMLVLAGAMAEALLGSFRSLTDWGYPHRRWKGRPDTALKLYSGRVALIVGSLMVISALVSRVGL